jgi:hypothetical protein
MGHELAETRAFKPSVKMERRRLDPEGRLAQFRKIQIDRVK